MGDQSTMGTASVDRSPLDRGYAWVITLGQSLLSSNAASSSPRNDRTLKAFDRQLWLHARPSLIASSSFFFFFFFPFLLLFVVEVTVICVCVRACVSE